MSSLTNQEPKASGKFGKCKALFVVVLFVALENRSVYCSPSCISTHLTDKIHKYIYIFRPSQIFK